MNKRLLEIMKEKEELRAKIKDGKDINLEEMMQKVEALNKEEKEIRTREKLLEDLIVIASWVIILISRKIKRTEKQ